MIIAMSPESILPAGEVINTTQSATLTLHPRPSGPRLPRHVHTELFVAVFKIHLHTPNS